MDEPTHANESRFWDEIADWLLAARAIGAPGLTPEEIEAFLRYMHERQEPR
jgi:hypothetical protein